MKKLISCVLLVCLVGFPSEAYAQFGSYETTGVGLGGGVNTGGNASAVGLNAGYVFGSPFELGGEFSQREFDDVDLTATRFGPYVTYYPIQEKDGYPFSILMRGSYNHVRFSGGRVSNFKQEGGSDTGSRFRFEIGAFSALKVSDSIHLVPYLGVSYALRTEADAFQAREELTGLTFRLSFQYKIGGAASIVLAPSAFVGENDLNRFGLSAALMISGATTD